VRNGIGEELVLEVPPLVAVSGKSGHKRIMEVPTLAGCGANVVAPTRCACSGQEHVLEAPNATAGCDEVRYQTSSASEVQCWALFSEHE
jgi:hypothetical protein